MTSVVDSLSRNPALGLALGASLSLLGCASPAVRDASLDTQAPEPRVAVLGRAHQVRVEEGVLLSVSGCEFDYRLYRPAPPAAEGLVILGPGFLRGKEHLAGLARALAAAGLATATLDYCNGRLWDGGHYQNGLDMVRLAQHLGARRVVYGGFSAGALAALVAGYWDPQALGVIALDMVDADGLGLRLAAGLDKPLIGLMGEPSACNAGARGLQVLKASRLGRAESVPGAGHCDFESPTDGFCELVCGQTAGASARRREIIATTVLAAVELMGPRPDRSDPPGRPDRT